MPISKNLLWPIAEFPRIAMVVFILLTGCTTLPFDHRENQNTPPLALLNIYHKPLNHLQAVRRGECPMVPSCSEFTRQAIAKHGPLKGWIMATDRLMRCGRDETRFAPKVLINGRVKYYDPVEGNDFWWAKKSMLKESALRRRTHLPFGPGHH